MREPEVRLTRAGTIRALGVSPELIAFFEDRGVVEFGLDGQIEITAFASAILHEAIALGQKAVTASRQAVELVGTVAECGAILEESFARLPQNAFGARAMRELLEDHVASIKRMHDAIATEWEIPSETEMLS